jgi:predicted AlkP superfamily phosphohydrolase/phosphomutase
MCGCGVARAQDERPKVVVIGFDGADARLVEQYMAEGKLPNLAKLRDEGSYAPLMPTNPPQTPVSWSSFATGTNPGKTEIFDFLKRDAANYLPDFAMTSETRRVFLFGERNALYLGLLGGGLALVLALLVLLFFPLRGALRAAGAVVLAVLIGVPIAWAARAYLPIEVPDAVNNRKGATMWELAARAGRNVQIIRVPATFPPDPVKDGHMLSGLGVPDMRGRIGTPAFYTSDPAWQMGDNEFSVELLRLPARRGKIQTRVVGPYNKPFYDYVVDRKTAGIQDSARLAEARLAERQALDDRGVPRRLDLPLVLEASDDSLTLTVSGQSRSLKPGAWSDWVELDFPVNRLVDAASPLRGIVRFKLLSLSPEIQLYMSPINFHPDCHPVAFAWPPAWSESLRERFGLYKTIGWDSDTWSPTQGVGGEELFLEDMTFGEDKYQQIMEGLLADGTADLYVQIFYFTDRIGHLFWRHLDSGHPLYDPVAAARWAPKMLEAYQRMDAMVGKARELAGPRALFMVCSDHGFSSFRRGVNYNTWLVRNGLMALKGQSGDPATLEKLFDTKDLFENVDWSRTKAYALGLGSIYVNLVGREKQGIVMPGPEYAEVVRQIKEGLEAYEDPDHPGQKPVARVWTRDEMYTGYDPNVIPDLRAANALNYRVSWQTSLGGVPPEIMEDNLKPWSGDHCSNDPSLVQGILFCNRKINTATPGMMDIMPTVLKALGVPVPAEVDGKPLL